MNSFPVTTNIVNRLDLSTRDTNLTTVDHLATNDPVLSGVELVDIEGTEQKLSP